LLAEKNSFKSDRWVYTRREVGCVLVESKRPRERLQDRNWSCRNVLYLPQGRRLLLLDRS